MANERTSGKASQPGMRLASGEDLEQIVRPAEGLISRRIFADPEVYERELEQIFGRAWFFIGHESEIPERGDIVARQCGVDPVILVRDQAGVVRAFLNSCRHRGMRLCRADRDNATALRCPYHGWTYRPRANCWRRPRSITTARASSTRRSSVSSRWRSLGSYRGLVFGSWDPAAPSLEEWLGDMRWYMDIIFGRTGEIEFVGVPQIWDVECSWKFATDNFTDNFHVFSAHQSLVELGMLPSDPDFARARAHGDARATATSCTSSTGAPGEEAFQGLGLPQVLCAALRRTLNPAAGADRADPWLQRRHDVAELPLAAAGHRGGHGERAGRRSSICGWRSRSARRARACTPGSRSTRTAPPEYRKISYETYVRCFGPSGHLRPGRHGELGGVHRRGARPGGQALRAASQDGPRPSALSQLGRARYSPMPTATAR